MVIGIADVIADLCDGEVRIREHCLCQLHFSVLNIRFQGIAVHLFEKRRDIFFIIPEIGGHFADLYLFMKPPGNVVDDIRIQRMVLGRRAARHVELAVQLAEGGGQQKRILVSVLVCSVAVLQLFHENEHAVGPRDFGGVREQYSFFVRRKWLLIPVVADKVVVAVIVVGKMHPVKRAPGRAQAVLAAGRAEQDIFPFIHGVFLIAGADM